MIDIEVKDNQLLVTVRSWSSKTRMAIKTELEKQSRMLANYVILRHLTGGSGFHDASGRLKVRTGHLRRTTRNRPVIDKGTVIEGGVEFGAKYASMHINKRGHSTTIRPKQSKNLAIPIMAGLTKAGAHKAPSPRDFPFLKFISRGSRPPLLAQVTKKAIYPYYVLVKSVVIPARVHPEDILRAKGREIANGLQRAIMAGVK